MDKPAINTKVNLRLKLFTELVRDDDKEALCLFKIAYLDPTAMQILKAK